MQLHFYQFDTPHPFLLITQYQSSGCHHQYDFIPMVWMKPPQTLWVKGPTTVQNIKICCGFFHTGFCSSDSRRCSEMSGSNCTKNYSGTPNFQVSGGPQPVICTTAFCSYKMSRNQTF